MRGTAHRRDSQPNDAERNRNHGRHEHLGESERRHAANRNLRHASCIRHYSARLLSVHQNPHSGCLRNCSCSQRRNAKHCGFAGELLVSAIPFPSIWTPKRESIGSLLDRMRRKSARYLAALAGDIRFGTGGHMAYSPTNGGHMVWDCGPPACGKCNSATTPAVITASLSGPTFCNSCAISGGGTLQSKWVGSIPTGPWDLPQSNSSACEWFLDVPFTGLTFNIYSPFALGCSGAIVQTATSTSYRVIVSVLDFAGGASTQISASVLLTMSPNTVAGSGSIFQNTTVIATPTIDCGFSTTLSDTIGGPCAYLGRPSFGASLILTV